jgi:hypothetical protein
MAGFPPPVLTTKEPQNAAPVSVVKRGHLGGGVLALRRTFQWKRGAWSGGYHRALRGAVWHVRSIINIGESVMAGRGIRWLQSIGFYDQPSPVVVDDDEWWLSISHWGLVRIAQFENI